MHANPHIHKPYKHMHAVHAQIPAPYVPYACTHARTHTRTYINALTHTPHVPACTHSSKHHAYTTTHTRTRELKYIYLESEEPNQRIHYGSQTLRRR